MYRRLRGIGWSDRAGVLTPSEGRTRPFRRWFWRPNRRRDCCATVVDVPGFVKWEQGLYQKRKVVVRGRGAHSAWTAYHSPVFLDPEWRQSKGTAAPPARQPNRPSRFMTPLRLLHQYAGRRAILGPPPRRSARHCATTPQSLRTGLPPGRPPDSSPMAGLRSSPV